MHQDARYENQKRDWTNVAYNMLHEQSEITQTVACNLLHEQDGIKQTTCLNERSFLGTFLPIHQNERRGISCIKMHATRIKNTI